MLVGYELGLSRPTGADPGISRGACPSRTHSPRSKACGEGIFGITNNKDKIREFAVSPRYRKLHVIVLSIWCNDIIYYTKGPVTYRDSTQQLS